MAIYIDITMTTISVRRGTLRALKRLKERMGADSYDEVLREMISREEGMPESMLGETPGLYSLSSEERRSLMDEEEHSEGGDGD